MWILPLYLHVNPKSDADDVKVFFMRRVRRCQASHPVRGEVLLSHLPLSETKHRYYFLGAIVVVDGKNVLLNFLVWLCFKNFVLNFLVWLCFMTVRRQTGHTTSCLRTFL